MTPIPSGSAAFLQQAHRNNWQRYIASLRDDARRGWDLCVLTASDERQAEMVRKQLGWRREANLLPVGTEFVVLADPEGRHYGMQVRIARFQNCYGPEGTWTGGPEKAPAAGRSPRGAMGARSCRTRMLMTWWTASTA